LQIPNGCAIDRPPQRIITDPSDLRLISQQASQPDPRPAGGPPGQVRGVRAQRRQVHDREGRLEMTGRRVQPLAIGFPPGAGAHPSIRSRRRRSRDAGRPSLGCMTFSWDNSRARALVTVEAYLACPAPAAEVASAADYFRATRAAAAAR